MFSSLEFDALLRSATSELRDKQSRISADFGLGNGRWRFEVDFDTAELRFFEGNRPTVFCVFTAIGSFAEKKGTWAWAWANKSLPARIATKSAKTRRIAEITGIPTFGQEAMRATYDMVEQMVALSCSVLESRGVYSYPQGDLRVFLAIDSIKKMPNQSTDPTSSSSTPPAGQESRHP